MKKTILIDTVEKIKEFVNTTQRVHYDIDLKSGTHTYVDGKSIMGILSCDCSQPMIMRINAEAEELGSIVGLFDQFAV